MIEAMGKFNNELIKAGIMKLGDCDGLTPSSQASVSRSMGPAAWSSTRRSHIPAN